MTQLSKEEEMNYPKQNEKWMCLECWKKLVAAPGESPPFPSMRMICEECGAKKVLVTNVKTDQLIHSSR
jgi:DNA-directed RNA polymerase subunit RPC12/RpoP